MTVEEEVARADEARFLLENPLFREAVKAVEEALIGGIKRSPIKETDLREKLCQQLVALEAVVGQIRAHIETGKLAQETIRQRTLSEKIKAAVNW